METQIALQKYFKIQEWVSQPVYDRHGERAWRFFDPRLMSVMLWLREGLGRPITANTWMWGGRFSQRGLRSNVDSILRQRTERGQLYLSTHVLGMGLDFDVEGMTAEQVRDWLEANADQCPYKIRLEQNMNGRPISWVHLDVTDEPHNPKVYRFDV